MEFWRGTRSLPVQSQLGVWSCVWRQLIFPVVLPQEKMLPENFVCFGPKSDVDRDEILSSVSTFLQDTYPGW